MKKSFDNRQACHVWAQQNQTEGYGSRKNIFFENRVIYSYGYHFPMALFLNDDLVLINSDKYSISTTRHQSYVRDAIHHKRRIYASTTTLKAWRCGDDTFMLADFLRCVNIDIDTAIENAANAKRKPQKEKFIWQASQAIESAREFYKVLEKPFPAQLESRAAELEKDSETVIINYAAALVKKEKQEKARAKRQLAKKKLEDAQKFSDWKKGKEYHCPSSWYKDESDGSAFLRVYEDDLQTSQGACAPLDHAIVAFKSVIKCKNTATRWKTNGHTIPVGHFKIEEITPEGNVIAGCHFIRWNEIERIAKQLNLI